MDNPTCNVPSLCASNSARSILANATLNRAGRGGFAAKGAEVEIADAFKDHILRSETGAEQ